MTRPLIILAALMLLAPGCRSDRERGRGGEAPDRSAQKPAPTQVPEQGPLAQRVLYEQAKGLLRGGRAAQAVPLFERAVAADPDGELAASAHLGLGAGYGELGQHAKAVAAYRKVVELRPNDPEAYHALAIGQEEAGDVKGAQRALAQAIVLDPDQLSAYQDLAALHLKLKDVEGAKQAYLGYELRRTFLIETLGLSKDPEQRAAAATALGAARDEATVKALGLALTDRDREVRLAVIRALAQQGLREGAGPLRERLARASDAEERRLIQVALDRIAKAAQPPPASMPAGAGAPAPVEDRAGTAGAAPTTP